MNQEMLSASQPAVVKPELVKSLVATQVIIAVIATCTSFIAAYRLIPLLKQERQLTAEVANLQARLRESTDLLKYSYDISFSDAKGIFGENQSAGYVLQDILQLRNQNIRFTVGGQSPEVGFDSPRFAIFLLRKHGLLPPSFSNNLGTPNISGEQQALMAALPRVAEPNDGDAVFYETGYTMFFYRSYARREVSLAYVIGMTPFGIVALNPDFARVIHYGRVPHLRSGVPLNQ